MRLREITNRDRGAKRTKDCALGLPSTERQRRKKETEKDAVMEQPE